MKLRIKGDSVRLRITQPELAALMNGQPIEETVHFGPEPGQRLAYRLQISGSGSDRIRAVYEDGRISVLLPMERAQAWSKPGEVSLSAEQPVGSGRQLSILIEKDFVCLDAPLDQQDADAFPNPAATCGETL